MAGWTGRWLWLGGYQVFAGFDQVRKHSAVDTWLAGPLAYLLVEHKIWHVALKTMVVFEISKMKKYYVTLLLGKYVDLGCYT